MSYSAIPYLILNEEFDAAHTHASKVKLWQSLTGYGDIFGLVFVSIFMYQFKWNWKVCLIIFIAFYAVAAQLVFAFSDEADMKKNIPI